MTRLLQVMAGAAHGGAEAFFERLALAFDRAGFDQHLVIRRNAGRAARLAGLPLTELGFGGRLDFLTKPRLARVIARVRPDVVFSWMNRATHFCPPPHGTIFC